MELETDKDLYKFKLSLKKSIDRVLDKYGYDCFYSLILHWPQYTPIRDDPVVDELDHSSKCIFCGGRTIYFDRDFQDPLCAECYAKIKGKG